MKRRLRICLLFLLSLALPLYGMAGSGLPTESCPLMMQEHETGTMAAMDMDMDCHEHVAESDHPAPHKGGLCDDGHVCKTGSILQVAVLKPPVVAPLPPQPGFAPTFLPSAANADVWRPPRG